MQLRVCVFLLHVVARSGALVTGQDNDPAACIVSVGSILCCAVCINVGVGNCVCVRAARGCLTVQ